MENKSKIDNDRPIQGFNWRVDVLHYPSRIFICPYCEDTFKRVRSYGKGQIYKFCPSCGMKIQK
jgi:hypothetical protein